MKLTNFDMLCYGFAVSIWLQALGPILHWPTRPIQLMLIQKQERWFNLFNEIIIYVCNLPNKTNNQQKKNNQQFINNQQSDHNKANKKAHASRPATTISTALYNDCPRHAGIMQNIYWSTSYIRHTSTTRSLRVSDKENITENQIQTDQKLM